MLKYLIHLFWLYKFVKSVENYRQERTLDDQFLAGDEKSLVRPHEYDSKCHSMQKNIAQLE